MTNVFGAMTLYVGLPLQVEVIDCVEDYLATLKEVFDFPALKKFLGRSDFKLVFDAMHAVTGAYAKPMLVSCCCQEPAGYILLQVLTIGAIVI